MGKKKISFEDVSINLILNPALRYVTLQTGTKYQSEYIINYKKLKYVPLFEVDDHGAITGDCTVFKLLVNSETDLKLLPIVTEAEWKLAMELVAYVEGNTEILKKQIERQMDA